MPSAGTGAHHLIGRHLLENDPNKLADLLASRFIQRTDVKAVQRQDAYIPDRSKWTRKDLLNHVAGQKSFGHYLVGQDGQCKLFAFDIDLTKWDEKSDRPQPMWLPIGEDGYYIDGVEPKPLQPRDAWLHPKAPPELKRYLTEQMRGIADLLARITVEVLGVPAAVAYSGSKGMHVYGFTGSAPAHDVRGAAMEVVSYADCFEPLRGKNFYKHRNDDPHIGYGCIDLEVFPKQDDLNGKDLGNLMRLPLGIHGKSKQRSHFVTLNSYADELVELDPVVALEGGEPWQ